MWIARPLGERKPRKQPECRQPKRPSPLACFSHTMHVGLNRAHSPILKPIDIKDRALGKGGKAPPNAYASVATVIVPDDDDGVRRR